MDNLTEQIALLESILEEFSDYEDVNFDNEEDILTEDKLYMNFFKATEELYDYLYKKWKEKEEQKFKQWKENHKPKKKRGRPKKIKTA